MLSFLHDKHLQATAQEGSTNKGEGLSRSHALQFLMPALLVLATAGLILSLTHGTKPAKAAASVHTRASASTLIGPTGAPVLDFGLQLNSKLNTALPMPAALPDLTGVTTDDFINMRTGAGTTYRITSQLPADIEVDVLGQQAGWYHVATAWDTNGWISAGYLKIVPDEASDLTSAQPKSLGSAGVVDGPLNLRAGPGTGYASYGMLAQDTVLDVLALQGDWYKVRSPRDTVGWVAAQSVALDWVPASYTAGGANTSATTSDVVRIAQKYLGARYVWGADGPSAFDCSGLTSYVYGQVGVWLPRVSFEQFSTDYGRVISSISALAPGDLVFFERTTADSGITHVGIYAGGGRMIAARTERLGVRYVGLYEPFWNSRFVGGLRPYR